MPLGLVDQITQAFAGIATYSNAKVASSLFLLGFLVHVFTAILGVGKKRFSRSAPPAAPTRQGTSRSLASEMPSCFASCWSQCSQVRSLATRVPPAQPSQSTMPTTSGEQGVSVNGTQMPRARSVQIASQAPAMGTHLVCGASAMPSCFDFLGSLRSQVPMRAKACRPRLEAAMRAARDPHIEGADQRVNEVPVTERAQTSSSAPPPQSSILEANSVSETGLKPLMSNEVPKPCSLDNASPFYCTTPVACPKEHALVDQTDGEGHRQSSELRMGDVPQASCGAAAAQATLMQAAQQHTEGSPGPSTTAPVACRESFDIGTPPGLGNRTMEQRL